MRSALKKKISAPNNPAAADIRLETQQIIPSSNCFWDSQLYCREKNINQHVGDPHVAYNDSYATSAYRLSEVQLSFISLDDTVCSVSSSIEEGSISPSK
jgi:hypothetical protein